MKIVELTQGSPEWLAHRAQHFNASDAPAMMGCSPYKTRAQLVREHASGVAAEVDAATQSRFDDGHRFEALARPLAEQIIGDDLYPVVGVDGEFSASFDGLTMLGDVAFEHKTINADLRAVMQAGDASDLLPRAYRVQMEHQLMVSRAERCLFMASKWSDDGELIEERHCWYLPDLGLRAEIVAGWRQFAADAAAYVPAEPVEPAPVGRAPDSLPALRIEINGAVTASNLAEFKSTALAAIGSVNRDLKTDADFADAEKAVKWCGEVEDRLAAAKQHALSQTSSIDELFRTMDDISAEARRVRLDLDKLVKARKAAIREDIVHAARVAFGKHLDALHLELEGVKLGTYCDFDAAIKGKKTVASLRDAADTALAQGKIAADEAARRVRESLAVFNAEGADHLFLFADRLQLVQKPAEDVRTLVQARIAKHRADEAARLDAERERIRAEEAARAQREAAAEAARVEAARIAAAKDEQDLEDARRRALALEAEAAKPAAPIPMQVAPADELKAAQQLPEGAELSPAAQALNEAQGAARFTATHPKLAAAFAQERSAEPATLKLGDINARLAPISISVQGLAELGITHSATDKAAKLYRASDFERICAALVEHIARVSDGVEA